VTKHKETKPDITKVAKDAAVEAMEKNMEMSTAMLGRLNAHTELIKANLRVEVRSERQVAVTHDVTHENPQLLEWAEQTFVIHTEIALKHGDQPYAVDRDSATNTLPEQALRLILVHQFMAMDLLIDEQLVHECFSMIYPRQMGGDFLAGLVDAARKASRKDEPDPFADIPPIEDGEPVIVPRPSNG